MFSTDTVLGQIVNWCAPNLQSFRSTIQQITKKGAER